MNFQPAQTGSGDRGVRMRILMLAQFYPPVIGGEERHVKTLGEALAQRGHSVSVATLHHGGSQTSVENGVTVHRLRGTLQRLPFIFEAQGRQHSPPFADPEITRALTRIISQEKPDIVHAHNWMMHSYLPLARRSGARNVMTLHDYSLVCAKKNMIRDGRPCSGPSLSNCIGCASQHFGAVKGIVTAAALPVARRRALQRIDKFIAVSEAVKVRSGLDGDDSAVEVIPNFIPDGLGSTAAGPRYESLVAQLPEQPYLLFVGDITGLKGIDFLLEAYGRLKHAPPLVLIGRRCADTPSSLPPGTRIFENWPHPAVLEAWQRCLFGILPSTGLEACATVVMEANAAGKPMIVSRTGGLPEIVDDGVTGVLTTPADASSLQTAMHKLLSDRDYLNELGAASRSKALTLMAAAIVPRIEEVYRDVLVASPKRLTESVVFSDSPALGA
jgi:glycosyltransferase involved in cell wall biosynthesis